MKKKILSILEFLVIIIIVLFCLMSVVQRVLPRNMSLFGFRTFSIITASMKPELEIGDIILVKEKKYDKIKIEDTITYQGMTGEFANKIVTHKVKNIITENGKYIYFTKGLNSVSTDPSVYQEQVYGVVVHKFIILSLINKIIQNTIGFVIIVIIPLLYLLVSEIINIIKDGKEKNKNNKIIEEDII